MTNLHSAIQQLTFWPTLKCLTVLSVCMCVFVVALCDRVKYFSLTCLLTALYVAAITVTPWRLTALCV